MKTVLINIPADMLALGLLAQKTDLQNKESCLNGVKAYLQPFVEAGPDAVLLNVCYRRSVVDSEVFDTVLYNIVRDENGNALTDENGRVKKEIVCAVPQNTQRYFEAMFSVHRTLLKAGIDVYKMAIDWLHHNHIQVWFSFRMNDHHFLKDAAVNSAFSLGHPSYCLPNGVFNYAVREVRTYFRSYISELAARYDIDGVELDFLRGAPYFKENSEEKCEEMTSLLREIRSRLEPAGRKLDIGVRVYARKEESLAAGLDVPQWVAEGLVNTVVISNFYMPTGFEPPVSEWREAIAEKGMCRNDYRLLCGCDYGVLCDRAVFTMTPELMRGFTATSLARGADGVYLFNIAVDDHTTSIYDEKNACLRSGMADILKASAEPNGVARYVFIKDRASNRYPIYLEPGQEQKIEWITDPSDGRVHLMIGVEEERRVEIRNREGRRVLFSVMPEPPHLSEILYEDHKNEDRFRKHIFEAAPVVLVTQTETVSGSAVAFTVANRDDLPLSIVWAELRKDNTEAQ